MTTDPHSLDLKRLGDWLSSTIAPFKGDLTAHKFGDGQSNPTYRLDAGDQHYVLRRKPMGKLLPSAHAVEREFRVIDALKDSGVPVPRAIHLCEDQDVIGSTFYLMSYVAGRHFPDPALPGVSPQLRSALYDALNDTIARLHQVDYKAVGLEDYGRPGNFVARQIERFTRQYKATESAPIPEIEQMAEVLAKLIPEQTRTSISHGDFRVDNVIFHPTEPKVIAVLDWELSTLGNPLADFAYHMIIWRLKREEYRFGIAEQDFATSGLPDEASYRAAYCKRTGQAEIPHWDFYMAFNLFRLSVILQGIAARAAAGNASNANAATAGGRARALAQTGWKLTQKL